MLHWHAYVVLTRRTRRTVHICLHIELFYCNVDPGEGGELENLDDIDEALCLRCIESHKNRVVGIKLRLNRDIANDGKHESEAYRYRTLESL